MGFSSVVMFGCGGDDDDSESKNAGSETAGTSGTGNKAGTTAGTCQSCLNGCVDGDQSARVTCVVGCATECQCLLTEVEKLVKAKCVDLSTFTTDMDFSISVWITSLKEGLNADNCQSSDPAVVGTVACLKAITIPTSFDEAALKKLVEEGTKCFNCSRGRLVNFV